MRNNRNRVQEDVLDYRVFPSFMRISGPWRKEYNVRERREEVLFFLLFKVIKFISVRQKIH